MKIKQSRKDAKIILILGRFAKEKMLRMSYTERNSNVKFVNLFRFGIIFCSLPLCDLASLRE